MSLLPVTAREPQPHIELVAVGDILLDRGVGAQIKQGGTRVVFSKVRDALKRADLAFGNLECPVTDRCERAQKRISFRAEPTSAQSLAYAGFDILSLANNHSMDCGGAGLFETLQNLKRLGLRWCGAGGTRAEAETPVLLDVRGIRIAFVGFTAIAPEGVTLKDDAPTVALVSRESLRRAIRAARQESDVVVVSLHWGLEYAARPGDEQKELAHAAAEAGADVVLGHHTHTLEGIELITKRSDAGAPRRALIAYSLGNFAFDSSSALGLRVRESIILRCVLDKQGLVSAEAVPILLENYLPRPAAQPEAQSILARLTALSAELNTRITNGQINLY